MGWTTRMLAPGLLALAVVATAFPGAASAGEVAASAQEICPLMVGTTVPNVEVQTVDGERVSLSETVWGGPTVLVFFRGGW